MEDKMFYSSGSIERYSEPYQRGRRTFIYDNEDCLVINVYRLTEKEEKENAEWLLTRGRPLYDEIIKGYAEIEAVGLRKENWENKDVRDEYLDEWNIELNEKQEYMLDDIIRDYFGLGVDPSGFEDGSPKKESKHNSSRKGR